MPLPHTLLQPRVTEKPPIAEAEILYAARLQQPVNEVTATPDLATAPTAPLGLPITLSRIVTGLETGAETVPLALVICSLDTSIEALEVPLGVARLHIPPTYASHPLTTPGVLTPTSPSDGHHDHDHRHLSSDEGVAALFPLRRIRGGLVASTAQEGSKGN